MTTVLEQRIFYSRIRYLSSFSSKDIFSCTGTPLVTIRLFYAFMTVHFLDPLHITPPLPS
jgi:hypothetical protein